MNDFDGLVAVVTGGASGIGAATAAQLRDRGARVAVLDRSYTVLDRDAMEVPCDVADADSARAAIDTVATAFGSIDVVINNAGIGASGDVAANADEEWHRVLSVNVIGIARITRAALPFLLRSSHAAIVNTCSVLANVGVPQRALYSASKGAVQSLTLAMAADFVRPGHSSQRRHARNRRHTMGETAARSGARRAGGRGRTARTPTHGPPRHGRGSRLRDRLPGEPAVGFDHRHDARSRRRHGWRAPGVGER